MSRVIIELPFDCRGKWYRHHEGCCVGCLYDDKANEECVILDNPHTPLSGYAEMVEVPEVNFEGLCNAACIFIGTDNRHGKSRSIYCKKSLADNVPGMDEIKPGPKCKRYEGDKDE